MKNKYLKLLSLSSIAFSVVLFMTSCGGANETSKDSKSHTKPLNITVLLDLSDRLTRELTPTQFDRDTAIVNYVVDKFIALTTKDGKLSKSNNSMKVVFYPTPSLDNVAQKAKQLNVDLSKAKAAEKKKLLVPMKQTFASNLTDIYNKTLETHNWVGCDIWGFFSSDKVDDECIKPDSRNILIILTDGYIYHKDNLLQDGDNYSYVVPATLANSKSGLIVKRGNLNDLEVLVLEVNPKDIKTSQQIHTVLTKWLEDMGVSKSKIVDTQMPSSTESVLDNFLKD